MGSCGVIFISHRGNLAGASASSENHPDQIRLCLSLGFHVEVDVWNFSDRLFLGHDGPDHAVTLQFLQNDKLWCHAKNFEALEYLIAHGVHCFWHQGDDCVLTSEKYIWTYPGKPLTSRSICVMPELYSHNHKSLKIGAGICTDFPIKYKEIINEIE